MSAPREAPIGARFGLWTVIGPPVADRRAPARCDCGVIGTPRIRDLLRGTSTGCWECGRSAAGLGSRKHGGTGTALYNVWKGMRGRCMTPSCTGFANYGGRGITVCEEWEDYPSFRSWALGNGYGPGMTIDRMDPDGRYSPSNCRWVTKAENSRRARPGGTLQKAIQPLNQPGDPGQAAVA